jgi:alkyl hydroperoxide reductase subunit AhpC
MEIPLVSDLTRDMSRAFGVLCEDSSDADCGVAFRGTFIMDPKGVVRSVQVRVCAVRVAGRSVRARGCEFECATVCAPHELG